MVREITRRSKEETRITVLKKHFNFSLESLDNFSSTQEGFKKVLDSGSFCSRSGFKL